jgi:hypothetical protein
VQVQEDTPPHNGIGIVDLSSLQIMNEEVDQISAHERGTFYGQREEQERNRERRPPGRYYKMYMTLLTFGESSWLLYEKCLEFPSGKNMTNEGV